MKVIKTQIEKCTISNIENFRYGSITVCFENFKLGQGEILIQCDGEAWSYYWGNMGECTIQQFFLEASTRYIVKKLKIGIDSEILNETADALIEHCKKWVISERREHELTREQAREAWSEIEMITEDGVTRNESHLQLILGDFWWENLPTKPNPKFDHLCTIVDHIKDALRYKMI